MKRLIADEKKKRQDEDRTPVSESAVKYAIH